MTRSNRPAITHSHQFTPVVAQPKSAVSVPNIRQPVAPPVYGPQSKPIAVQQKMAGPSKMKMHPAAPPVYRPQSVPKVLQTRLTTTRPTVDWSIRSSSTPVSPQAYRPQPTPKVLQTKLASGAPSHPGRLRARPLAPPVYRPEQKRIAQPKMASAAQMHLPPKAPPVYRPQAKPVSVQAKMAVASRIRNQPVAPPVYRPQPVPKVLQTKKTVTQQGGQRQQEHRRLTPPVQLAGRLAMSSVNTESSAKSPVHQPFYKPAPRFAGSRPVGAGSIQRYVDESKSDVTSTGKYLVEQENSDVLYSTRDAEPPEPVGLYARGTDFTMRGMTPVLLNSWTPNVRMLDKEQAFAEAVKEKPGTYRYKTTDKSGSEITKTYNIKELQAEVLEPRFGWKEPPTVGALGKNDCNVWATTLQNLIADKKRTDYARVRGHEDARTVYVQSLNTTQADLTVNVGDRMRHIFPNWARCLYHAATIVAKDGNSVVTLEGHVSKDLSRPQFHIRAGLAGFANEGIVHNLGDEVEVIPVTSLSSKDVREDKETREDRFHKFSDFDPNSWKSPITRQQCHVLLSGEIGITPTLEESRRIKKEEARARQIREDELIDDELRKYTYLPPDVFPY